MKENNEPRFTHDEVVRMWDGVIEQLESWIRIAPVEYPKEWAELQIRMKKREEKALRAARRKEKRLNRSAFRKKSQS